MKKKLLWGGVLLVTLLTFAAGCKRNNDDDDDDDSSVKTYYGPTYNDNYVGYSGWKDKDKWNLANVHDPTVFKWTDGYFYMFGTDASYGNAHENATTGKHFQGKRSKDLINWEWVPGIMDKAPDWVLPKLNEIRKAMDLTEIASEDDISWGYWAPSARTITVDGVTKVRIYYSIVVDNYIKSGLKAPASFGNSFDGSWGERAFIGVAESTNPSGGPSAWEDKGFVVCSSSDRGTEYTRKNTSDWDGYFYFNAIDPTYFIDDDGSHWMAYGSWHSGFALVRINPATGKVAAVTGDDYLTGDVTGDFAMGMPWSPSGTIASPKPEELKAQGYGTRIYTRKPSSRWQGSEGPELVKYNGYYYLFFANDGLDIPYHTRVVRAQSITGPYYDIRGKDFTSSGDGDPYPIVTRPYKFTDEDNGLGSCYGWVGISHCAIFQDGDDWYYMSQQRLPAKVANNEYSNAIMMGGVREIAWTPADAGGNDLWPIALPERYGNAELKKAGKVSSSELAGTWQHINLTSASMSSTANASELTLNADGTMSGALTGTWEFDKDDQQLTFKPASGNSVTVTVAREIDWEKNPRVSTIVYAGTQTALNRTYWGKKEGRVSSSSILAQYTLTITEAAKNDLAWYLYPQAGEWSVTVNGGAAATVSGTGTWWNASNGKSEKVTVEDGKTVKLTASTKSSAPALVIEGFSTVANTFADIDPHAVNTWGDAVASSGNSDTRKALAKAAVSLTIEISRSGAEQTVTLYKEE